MAIRSALLERGYQGTMAKSHDSAMEVIQVNHFDLVIPDNRRPRVAPGLRAQKGGSPWEKGSSLFSIVLSDEKID
jgi:hypothetical protein